MSKVLLSAFLFLALLSGARADFVVQRKITAGSEIRYMTLKFKGERARVELPVGEKRKIVLLLDLAKDEIYNLIPDKKNGFHGKLSERRRSRERALESHGIRPGSHSPTRTGQTKQIGEYKAEEYVIGAVGLHIWVAPEYPRWREIQAQLDRFSKAESGGALSPDCMGLPGLVMESRNPGAQGVEVTTLESVREEPVPESDLAVPEGFNIQPFPSTGLGAPPPQLK